MLFWCLFVLFWPYCLVLLNICVGLLDVFRLDIIVLLFELFDIMVCVMLLVGLLIGWLNYLSVFNLFSYVTWISCCVVFCCLFRLALRLLVSLQFMFVERLFWLYSAYVIIGCYCIWLLCALLCFV